MLNFFLLFNATPHWAVFIISTMIWFFLGLIQVYIDSGQTLTIRSIETKFGSNISGFYAISCIVLNTARNTFRLSLQKSFQRPNVFLSS